MRGPESVGLAARGPIRSLAEEVADCLLHNFATDLGNRSGERNIFRANLDAVLRVATFLNAAVTHQCGQTFTFQDRACGVGVEQENLGNCSRAHDRPSLF
jgi:hypothetical protein